jgi:WD40 repeat protein
VTRPWLLVLLAACRLNGDAEQAAPIPKGAGALELGLPIGAAHVQGGYVVYRVQPRDYDHSARGEVDLVVDPATGAMLELDKVKQLEIAGSYAIVDRGDVLAVHDLATGAATGESTPITGSFTIAPDGRIAWAERAGDAFRIHLRVPGGADTVLAGLPADPSAAIQFAGGRVIASTSEALRVWENGQLIISRNDPMEVPPTVSADEIAYAANGALHVIDLASRKQVELHADPICGSGTMDLYAPPRRCADHQYLVQSKKSFCVWNTATGRVQARFAPLRDEVHCGEHVAWVGDSPPGGPYDFYSIDTGKRIRPPHELPGEPDGDAYESIADPRPDPEVAARIPDADELVIAGDLLAGTHHERAALWTTAGELRWQSAASSVAAAAAFSPTGELAVVGRAGEVWYVDLAKGSMRTGTLERCELDDVDPVVVGPDGHVAAACERHEGRALVVEGTGTVFQGGDYGWYVTAAATRTAARIGWLSYDGIHEWSLADRSSRLKFDPEHYGLTFTADAVRFATAQPVGDPRFPSQYTVTVRGGTENTPLRSIAVASEPGLLALSPDGAQLAISMVDKRVLVVDALTGTTLDTLDADTNTDWTRAPLVAWDPAHATHLAYFRDGRVAIRDVRAGKDLEMRAMVRPASGRIRGITWSLDGTWLALVADQMVTVWDGATPPVTLAFTGTGGVMSRADGRAVLLGDPAAARSLLACRRGRLVFASLDGCEQRVE